METKFRSMIFKLFDYDLRNTYYIITVYIYLHIYIQINKCFIIEHLSLPHVTYSVIFFLCYFIF